MQLSLINLMSVLLTSFTVFVVLSLIASYVFDFKQKVVLSHATRRKKSHRPKYTIVVFCDNHAKYIAKTLSSIIDSSYRKYQIIFVDNVSNDDTKELLRTLKSKYKKQEIRLVFNKKRKTQEFASSSVVKSYANGDIILFINGSTILEKNFLKILGDSYQSKLSPITIFNRKYEFNHTLLSTVYYIYRLPLDYTKKLRLLINLPWEYSFDEVIYSRKEFLDKRSTFNNLGGNIAYLDNARIWKNQLPLNSPGSRIRSTNRSMLSLLIKAIKYLVIIISIITVSIIIFYEKDYLAFSIISIILAILYGILLWDATGIDKRRKLQVSVYLPIAFWSIAIASVTDILVSLLPRTSTNK